jgi:hypothetical protein
MGPSNGPAMTKLSHFKSALFAMLAVAGSSWCGPASSNPDCSLADIGQAAKDTFTNIPASCAPQAADPAFYPLLAYVIALLQTPQGNEFCNAVESGDATASKVSSVSKNLPGASDPAVAGLLADLTSGTSAVSGAIDVASCACKTAQWKGPGDLAGDFGACVSDALCSAQDWFHDHISSDFGSCSGPPPQPPQLIDCRVDPCAAGPHACDLNVPVAGQDVQCYGGDPGYTCQGSFCFSESLFSSGQGNYCFCPPQMQRPDGFMYDINGSCEYYVRCACPEGSKALSDSGAGAYICVCPDTGLPINDDGSCPKPPPKCEPSCPAGQITKISDHQNCSYSCDCPDGLEKVGGKCVAPCSGGEVLLQNGVCCSASQATSCGTCCPAGMKPDGDTCIAPVVVNPLPHPSLNTPKKL